MPTADECDIRAMVTVTLRSRQRVTLPTQRVIRRRTLQPIPSAMERLLTRVITRSVMPLRLGTDMLRPT